MRKSKKILILIILILLSLPAYTIFADQIRTSVLPTYYEKVKIHRGDTLYSLSQKYNTSNMPDKEFVKYLIKFNKMDCDTIYYNNNIIIPMFNLNANI